MKKKLFWVMAAVLLVIALVFVRFPEAVVMPPTPSTPTLSVIEAYGQAVQKGNEERVLRFVQFAKENGSPDYSGMGYESCTADSDCLSGVQTCKAGIIPSSPVLPGYCVPNP
jgi:hypothetical protein